MKKSTKIISAGLAVLALGGLAVGGYFTYKHFNPAEQQKPVDPGVTPPDDGGEEQPLLHVMTFKVGDELLPAVNVATGGLITPPADPTKEGYIFAGWALEGTETPVDLSTLTATENMTFVALWIDEPVEVDTTSASQFTFKDGAITGYLGEEEEITTPKSYSLGEIVKQEQAFADYYSLRTLLMNDESLYPLSVTDSTDAVFEITDYKTLSANRQTMTFPVSAEVPVQTFIDGKDFEVTSIGNFAFKNNETLNRVVVSEGVTKIGGNAFQGCSILEEVVLPNGLAEISSQAFYGSSIQFISIPDSLTTLSGTAFDECENMIFNNLNNCYYLGNDTNPYLILRTTNKASLKLVIEEGCKFLYTQAFASNTALTEVSLPESIISLGTQTFKDCTALAKINIPASITSFGNYTFQNCTSLTSMTIPDSVEKLGNDTFNGCSNLAEVNLPTGLLEIGDRAFYNCTSLVSIALPESLTQINSYAFTGCSGLTKITIPANVTQIRSNAFSQINNLVVIMESATPTTNYGYMFTTSATIYVPDEAVESYQTTWTGFVSRIKPYSEYVEV